jgi:kynurenine formamidase
MEIRMLSRVLQPGGIVWPGDPTLRLDQIYDISRGDACNAFVLHLLNHYGTHVDGPRHFNPEAQPLAALPPDYFVFRSVALLDLPCGEGGTLAAEDLAAALPRGWLPDLLMIRTGFALVRDTDPGRYVRRGPTLAPEAAALIVNDLSSVRAIAVDCLSVGSVERPEENLATHRTLCGVGRQDGRFVLIYEDVNMEPLGAPPLRVWGTPLLVEGLDSAPVVMLAEV